MKRLIYSYLITKGGATKFAPDAAGVMLDLWVRSLRGAGNFQGDIVLFTDSATLQVPTVSIRPLTLPLMELKQLWLMRILNYKNLPYQEYDSIMHLDLDTICVNDINDLFATNDDFRAAPSNLFLFEPKHVGQFLDQARRIWYGFFSPRKREKGISACIFSCTGAAWEKNMGAWVRIIEQRKDGPVPELGDQSFLNLLYFQETISIKPYSREEIQHKDWSVSLRTKILHFPGLADQAALMERYFVPAEPLRNPLAS